MYRHDHLQARMTYTPGDTFTAGTHVDTVCSPKHPDALLRRIMGAQGFNPELLKCIGARKVWENSPGALKINIELENFIYAEAHLHGPLSWRDDTDAIYSTRGQAEFADLVNPPDAGKLDFFTATQPPQQQEAVEGGEGEVDEPQPEQEPEEEEECPLFKPNRWKPNLCTVCQSTPGSQGCRTQRGLD